MRIFDLLEGNLSEAEKNEVLKEIEKHAALKHEYNLMRQTYLQAEPMLQIDKTSLYRKQGGALTFIFSRKFAAAAAVAIIFGSLSVYWFTSQKNNTEPNISQTPNSTFPPQTLSPLNQEKSKETTSNPTQIFADKKQNNRIVFPGSSNQNLPDKNNPKIEFAPIHIADPEFVIAVQNALPIDTQNTEIIAFQNPEITMQNDTDVVADINGNPVPYQKKKSLGYKLLNNSRKMMANLQMPNVKFKTEKKPHQFMPKLKMEISTPKTEIIATLID